MRVIRQYREQESQRVYVLLGLGVLLLCSLVIAVGGVLGYGAFSLYREKQAIEGQLDEFMVAMTAQDIPRAYGLFSARAKTSQTQGELRDLLNNYALFEGYKHLEVDSIDISTGVAADSSESPSGTVATVRGRSLYADGTEGQFTAQLEKTQETWYLFSVLIEVPPEKTES